MTSPVTPLPAGPPSRWSRAYWLDLADRVLSSAAQGAVGVVVLDGFNVLSGGWLQAGSAAATMALLTLLKGLAAGAVGRGDTAGFTPEEPSTGRHAA